MCVQRSACGHTYHRELSVVLKLSCPNASKLVPLRVPTPLPSPRHTPLSKAKLRRLRISLHPDRVKPLLRDLSKYPHATFTGGAKQRTNGAEGRGEADKPRANILTKKWCLEGFQRLVLHNCTPLKEFYIFSPCFRQDKEMKTKSTSPPFPLTVFFPKPFPETIDSSQSVIWL